MTNYLAAIPAFALTLVSVVLFLASLRRYRMGGGEGGMGGEGGVGGVGGSGDPGGHGGEGGPGSPGTTGGVGGAGGVGGPGVHGGGVGGTGGAGGTGRHSSGGGMDVILAFVFLAVGVSAFIAGLALVGVVESQNTITFVAAVTRSIGIVGGSYVAYHWWNEK